MKIGYPCLNTELGCKTKTFRLKSYSAERLIESVAHNLDCLERMLEYNVQNRMLFFRISSDIVPFASHPVCRFNWQEHFAEKFTSIGRFIAKNNLRISMHPDQFTLINSPSQDVWQRSVEELLYHAQVLDAMKLKLDAKIQIHIGGVYNDRPGSIERFAQRYSQLPQPVRRRLVIENDGRLYSLSDCMEVHELTGVPVLFDTFHHVLYNAGLSMKEALARAAATWKRRDGIAMIDYSSAKPDGRAGSHAQHIDGDDFAGFLKESAGLDFDIMLEIKDKQASAKQAVALAERDSRFVD